MTDLLKSKGLLVIALVLVAITYLGAVEPSNMAENDKTVNENIATCIN